MMNQELAALAIRAGIVFDGATGFVPRFSVKGDAPINGSMFAGIDQSKLPAMALDAVYNQPGLITQPNSGVLSAVTMLIDPKLIEVLLSPMNSEEIYGSAKKGDWTTTTIAFGMIEMTGGVAGYGDYNEAGRSDINANWPMRQNYGFQTFIEYGDKEVEIMGLARIDLVSRKRISAANSLNRFANYMNFFGMPNLQNYGGLNDPSLSAAITPATKAAGGTSWSNALPQEILADIQALFARIQNQSGGNLTLDMEMTLAISPTSDVYMVNTNSFGITTAEMIRKAFPRLTIKTAVQYISGTTYSAQLIVKNIEGQATAETAFSEKMRGHRVIPAASSYRQKSSAAGYGTVFYRPLAVAIMAGI